MAKDIKCLLYAHWCRRVYLAYLDSINLFRPSHLRTMVYQQLLIAYFEHIRSLGYFLLAVFEFFFILSHFKDIRGPVTNSDRSG